VGNVLIGPGVGTLGEAVIGGLAGNKHAKEKNERRSGEGRSSGDRRRSLSRDSRDSH
jgi:hypothetical protein